MTILAYFRFGSNQEAVSIVTEAPEEGTDSEITAFFIEEYGEEPYEYITLDSTEDVHSWPTDRLLTQ